MKKVIIIIVIVVIAFIAYNYISKGNSSSLSPDEQKLERLIDDMRRVRKDFRIANSSGALGGADITDDIDEAYSEIARIESSLKTLKRKLTTESAKEKAGQLQNDVDAFKKSLK